MKKITLTTLVLLVLVILACHKKTIPAATDQGMQTAAPVVPAPPVMPIPPAIPAAELAAGKTIYETKCARCHAPKPVDAYTTDRWAGILRSMVPKARLDSVQTTQVTLYVNANAKKS